MEKRAQQLQEALDRLDHMIGLHEIKRSIAALQIEMRGRQRVAQADHNIQNETSYHMMFSGDAGTGKTEVARIIAQIMYGANVSRTNTFIEVDRSDIVGEYIGHTEAKMKRLIEQAKGGVLFIDEAYALVGEGNDFGKEAINVLIKAMEDERDDLIIILAGYRAEMRELMKMNEGFRSRIPYHFIFPNYTPSELAQIIVRIVTSRGFDSLDILGPLKQAVSRAVRQGSVEGNGRWARNQAERLIKAHYARIGLNEQDEPLLLTESDVTEAFEENVQGRSEDEEGLLRIQEEALQQLNQLVGLDTLKETVQRWLQFVAVENERKRQNIETTPMTMHMTFTGPPGTGKTTVARIIGRYLYGLGILPASTFIEADRSDLVGRYIGQTEAKTMRLIERADGGVLFIDEAYALAGDGKDFGRQAIDTLIKEMEERKDRLIVILAGYDEEMKALYEMNPGLRSRVPHHFSFPNYKADELYAIACQLLKRESYVLTAEAEETLKEVISFSANHGKIEGNGRWVRNRIDAIRLMQSNRVFAQQMQGIQQIEAIDIQRVWEEDEGIGLYLE